MNEEERKQVLRDVRRRSLMGVALAAGAFAALIAAFLLWNYRAVRAADPLANATMAELKGQAQQAPDDQQVRKILREYDLLLRQNYFQSRTLQRTGSYLLAGTLGVMLLFFHLAQWGAPRPRQTRNRDGASRPETPAFFGWALLAVAGFGALVLVLTLRHAGAPDGASASLPAGSAAPVEKDAGNVAGGNASVSAGTAEVIPAEYRPAREDWLRNWPSFRGPLQNGLATLGQTEADTAAAKAETWRVAWQTPVPRSGRNSPVIWEDRIFLAGADKPDAQELYCFSAQEGKLLWTLKIPPAGGDAQARAALSGDAGFAAPTVVTDGRRVCVIFATGDVAAADFSGRLLWSRNLGVPQNHYGYASSLAYFDGRIIAQWDNAEGRKLIALAAADGKTVWETARPGEMAWSSPVLLDAGAGPRLLTTAAPYAIAYDPASGKELWRCECLSGEVAPSATANGRHYFVAMQYSDLTAIRPGGSGEIAKKQVEWRYSDNLPDTSSPLATGAFVIFANSAGFLSCVNAADGKELWADSSESVFFASPLLVGTTVFLPDNQGLLRLFAAAGEYKKLQEINLAEECGPSPAYAAGRVFVRGKTHLFCLVPDRR